MTLCSMLELLERCHFSEDIHDSVSETMKAYLSAEDDLGKT